MLCRECIGAGPSPTCTDHRLAEPAYNPSMDKGPEQATILLCLPGRHILRLVQVNLQRQGYRVIPTHSGAEALESLDTEPRLEIVVLDADLRNRTANELIATIKSHETHSGARIIVLGAKDDDNHPSDGDLYITKPFSIMDLVRGNGPTAGIVACA